MRERGRRAPRLHASEEAAVAAFRLLPRETIADPALLAHMARMGLVRVDGGFRFRFDPACYADRKPVDCWPLLPRITAPTLVVRGEHSPVLPLEMAARMLETIPNAELIEIPGAHHHLTLDAPDAFNAALDTFLRRALGSGPSPWPSSPAAPRPLRPSARGLRRPAPARLPCRR